MRGWPLCGVPPPPPSPPLGVRSEGAAVEMLLGWELGRKGGDRLVRVRWGRADPVWWGEGARRGVAVAGCCPGDADGFNQR